VDNRRHHTIPGDIDPEQRVKFYGLYPVQLHTLRELSTLFGAEVAWEVTEP
jgi:hypothetical protein